MEECEVCGFKGDFITEEYGSNIITFCPDCWKNKYYTCKPEKSQPVKYLQNGSFVVRQMCSHCFEMFGSFVKQAGLNLQEIRTIEKENHDKYVNDNQQKFSVRHGKLNQQHRDWDKVIWLQKHNDYLSSPEWRQRRDEVLKRDNYLCQACRKKRATQVHHLSYDHWMNEPLFELISICQDCHEKITEMDRNKQAMIS